MYHLDQFIFDMGCLCAACHLNCNGCCTDQDIADTDFASAVGLTVESCETLYDHACKCNFAVEVDVLVRDKYAVEDNKDFVSAVCLIADVNAVVLFQLSGIAGLTSVDQRDAFCVCRAGEADCIVFIAFTHGNGRHNQNFMRVYIACLMCLCTCDIDTVLCTLNNVQEQIRISLFGRSKTSVALDVCHSAVNCQVLILYTCQELQEVLMILCAACLINLIG